MKSVSDDRKAGKKDVDKEEEEEEEEEEEDDDDDEPVSQLDRDILINEDKTWLKYNFVKTTAVFSNFAYSM